MEALTLRDTPDAFLTPAERETKHAAIAIARDAQQIAVDPEHRPRADEVTTLNVSLDKRLPPPTNFFREFFLLNFSYSQQFSNKHCTQQTTQAIVKVPMTGLLRRPM